MFAPENGMSSVEARERFLISQLTDGSNVGCECEMTLRSRCLNLARGHLFLFFGSFSSGKLVCTLLHSIGWVQPEQRRLTEMESRRLQHYQIRNRGANTDPKT
jgi:hypothetical protein